MVTGLVRTNGQATFSVALDRMNILYIGIENPVSLAVSGSGDEGVTASLEGGDGSIEKVGPGKYVVRVSKLTDDCKIHLSANGEVVGTSQFRVRSLPVPIGTVGGFASGDAVPAGAFKAQQGIGVYLLDFPFELRYNVTGYTLRVEDENGKIKSADCQGAYFSPQAKELIQRYAKPGKTVSVGNLVVKDAGGRSLKLSPLVYLIK